MFNALTKESVIKNNLSFTKFIPYIFQENLINENKGQDRLYHYTNLDGLKGIIDNSGFWASHISFLNDEKEYIYGLEIYKEVLEEFKELTIQQNIFITILNDLLNNDDETDFFVISLCSNGDLLSQWRGYSRGQYGVSIGLKYTKLIAMRKVKMGESSKRIDEIINPLKIIYDESLQKKIIRDIISIALEGAEDLRFAPKEALQTLRFFILLFKHNSFQEENEWRIITPNNFDLKYPVEFRVRENIILPYLDLPFYSVLDLENPTLPIEEIIVGPFESKELTKKSIDYFLKNKGLGNVETRLSNIPYR